MLIARTLQSTALGLLLAIAASPATAEVRTFREPMIQGQRLAYCDASGEVCGSEIARMWCADEGFETATAWAIASGAEGEVAPALANPSMQAFASITCSRPESPFMMPNISSFERSTVFSPNRRSVQTSLDAVEYQVLIPGCHQRQPGVFLCESVHEYQHCRTLYRSGRVFGCRAGVAFNSGFAVPNAAAAGEYSVTVASKAEAIVESGKRGDGRLRGDVEYVLSIDVPDTGMGRTCLQRDRYVYYSTGPAGGMESIDETAECSAPIEGSFEPHEDDLLRAWDECATAGAWGSEIQSQVEVLVAGLFHMATGDVTGSPYGSKSAVRIEAPYVVVRAPMTVDCRE